MSGQSRDRRKRNIRNFTRHQVERLEGRALLASIAEFGLTTGSAPTFITTGPNGNLWFTESGTNKIGEISTSGTVTEFALASGSNPQGITTGPDGNLWFAEYGTDKIGQITTGGTVTEFALTSGSHPQEITTGSNGNLWFTEYGTDKIGEIVPSGTFAGTITEFALAAGSHPYGITSGPNGNLWFTENGANKVGQVVPSGTFAGTINTYSLSNSAGPEGITTGSDGNLWFAENGTNNIGQVTLGGSVTEYSVPGSNYVQQQIVSGPSGDLYFTEAVGNNLIQMTTQGQFTDYAVPTSGADAFGITQGPDNHIWFAENGVAQIGRLNLNPTAVNDTYTASESTAASPLSLTVNAAGGVLANDTDPENDALSVLFAWTGSRGTNHGVVSLNSDGSFYYTPDNGFIGTDSFVYQATDGDDSSITATVTIHVDAPPVAVNDAYITPVSTSLTVNAAGGVLANDTDPNSGHTLTSGVVAQPTHGTLTLNANGSFTYIPNAGYHGTDSFIYRDTDSDGVSIGNTATVTIAVDTAPVAVNDHYTTDAGTGLAVTLPANGVLANDTDADGDPLTAIAVTQPANGTLFLFASGLNADGTFTYYPNIGFTGTDSFTYKVNDGSLDGNTVTVTITVNPLPVAVNDSYEVLKNGTLTLNAGSGVLANDTGAGTLTSAVVGNPAHGTVSLNANGSLTYIPTAGYSGNDSFTYKDNDGIADGNTATVNIKVDNAPVATADTYQAFLNTTLSRNAAQGVLANDTDSDGDPTTAAVVANTTHGSVTLNANGSFTYIPNAGYFGPDSFTYKANDGFADGNTVTVTLNIDAPPVAINKSYTDVKNTSLNVLAGQGLLVGATDAEGDPLTAVVVGQPSHGTVTVNANGSFSYIPTTGYFGNDSFTFAANDGITNGNTATVSVYVDQPPVGTADNYTVVENTGLTRNAAQGVLANDTNTNTFTNPVALTAGLITTTTHGALTLFNDGSFNYVPTNGYYGSDSFTYQANDGITDSPITTVSIRVDAPPVGVADSYNAIRNTTLTRNAAQGVLANDSDPDNTPTPTDTLTSSLISNAAHGVVTLFNDGSFTYVPNNGYTGSDSFTYKPYDQITNGNLTTVNIRVDAPPVAINDSYTTVEGVTLTRNAAQGVLANDADADADPITAVIGTNTAHGSITLNADGSFTYVPNAGFFGTDSFTYNANDGYTNSPSPATVTIRVDAPPVAVADSYTTVENTTLTRNTAQGVLFNDTDADGDPLTAVVVANTTHGTLSLSSNGSLTYIPTAGYFGNDSFTYKANDGITDSPTATVNIRVDAPPVAINDSYTTVEGVTLTRNAAQGVLANDTDPDADPLTAVVVANTTHGSITLNADGSFTYIPTAGYFGNDSFTYRANDGIADSPTATVSIRVDAPPVAVNDSYNAREGRTLTLNAAGGVLANDTDAEGDPLTAFVVSGPTHGTLTLNSDGSLTYIPTGLYFGPDSFTYKVNDGTTDGLAPATVTFNVVQDNAPVAVAESQLVGEGGFTATAPGILANDTDADSDLLSTLLVAGPAHGTLTFLGDGSYTYVPDSSFGAAGSDSFTYRAFDGVLTSNVATVTLTFDGTYYAPVAQPRTYSVAEGATLTTSAPGVLAGAADYWNLGLTAVDVTQPAHGTLSLNADGSFTYTPTAGFFGTDSFTYESNNGHVNSSAQAVTLNVSQVFGAPVAVSESYATSEATPLTMGTAQGVLANDTDPQGHPLSAILVTNPAHGSVALNADGSFTYTPAAGYFGADSFTYKANNGSSNSNTATVSFAVAQVFYAPVAANNSFTTPEGTTFGPAGSNLLANDTDPQGLALTVANPGSTATAHGILNLGADGTFNYTPNAGFYGTDSFTYTASDGHNASNTATVTITVAQVIAPPVAVADSFTLSENATLATTPITGVLANDTDPQGSPLTAILVTNPAHGAVAFNADGSFTYTPTAYYSGVDSFTYKANDGSLSGNTATVNLVVAQVQYAPVAVADAYTVAQDATLSVPAGTSPLVNDSHPAGDPFYFYPINIHTTQGGLITMDTPGTGAFTYVPAAGFHGTDSFTYYDVDSNNSLPSNTVTVTITVTPTIVGAPVAVNDGQSVGEGGITVNAPGILANDTDNSVAPLTALLVSGTSHGTLSFHGDGTYTYIPDSSFGTAGTDSFSYRASDGSLLSNVATVTLTFDGNYDRPTGQDQAYHVAEGSTLATPAPGLLAGAGDYWSLPLGVIVDGSPSHGTLNATADGAFTYTPDANYVGPDGFTYVVNNGHSNSVQHTVTLTVAHVNHPPVSDNDSYTTTARQPTLAESVAQGVLANDTDADGDALAAILVNGPSHGTLNFNANGSFTYTAALGFHGADSFTYEAFDGQGLGNIATVGLTVPPPPVAVKNDYDGDGKADIAVYIPSIGAYDIKFSGGFPEQLIRFGRPGAGMTIPAPGDYDHSGKAELAIYDVTSGSFIYRPANGGADVVVPFGGPGLGKTIPAPGDYFGTGQTDIAAYLPAIGAFGIRNPAGGPDLIVGFGAAGAGQSIPATGDYDHSGKAELAVYLPAMGAYAFRPANGGPDRIIPFGIPGAGQSIPVPGDYDGSGMTELAVYLPSQGRFAYRSATIPGPDVNIPFGPAGAGMTLPAPGDYTGVGHDQVAAYLPGQGLFAIVVGGNSPGIMQPVGIPGLGQSFAVTAVDEALAQIPPMVSGLSISIPDIVATKKKK